LIDATDFFNKYLPAGLPEILHFFVLSEEDIPGENMIIDEIYACYEEDDLYVKIATPSLKRLETLGITPISQCVSFFG
jgi:hypothetical protein